MLFIGQVEVTPGVRKNALLHQAAPGAAITKVVLDGEAVPGLTNGRVLAMQSSDGVYFNDAGQVLFAPTTVHATEPASNLRNATALIFGTPTTMELVATVGTTVSTPSGSVTLTGITTPSSLGLPTYSAAAGMPGAQLDNAGGFAFRAVRSGQSFGSSNIFAVVGSGGVVTPPDPVTPTLTQKITFPALAPATYGNPPRALGATASSGLPVSFAVVSGLPASPTA